MGICKCRKRTQIFCFVHRKPVCTTCVLEHPICAIGPYLDWLKDSDYATPTCQLCSQQLIDDPSAEPPVRLTCLHTFHPRCIEEYANQQPAHTALAGFTCATCSRPIIPVPEDQTELAIELRRVLEEQSWAKPFLHEEESSSTIIAASTSTPGDASTPERSASHTNTENRDPYNFAPVSRKVTSKTSKREEEIYPDDEDKHKYRRKGVAQLLGVLGILQPTPQGYVLNSKRLLASFLVVSVVLLVWVMIKSAASVEDEE